MQTFHLFSTSLSLLPLIVMLAAAAGNNDGSPLSCSQICDYIEIEGDAYCGQRNLTEVPHICSESVLLNMRGNDLRDLQQGEFREFTHLKFLDLSANSLENLPPRVFSGATQLQDVYIIDNHLTNVGHDAFADTGNIRSIYLNRNNIQALPPSVFRGLGHLNVLFLSQNRLSYVSRHMFLHNNNLTHLSLAHNQLEILLAETFKHLTKLEFLDVSFNSLHNLRIHAFSNLFSLRILKAANNCLTSDFIDADLLESSPKLEYLELSGNEIESVPSSLEESHLAKLHLARNPLICDCSLRPLQNAYINTPRDEESWVNQVTCSNGELLITTSLECPIATSTEIAEVVDKVGMEKQDGDIDATIEVYHRGPNSIIVPIVITGVVFVVCSIICTYVMIKWIISCKEYPDQHTKDSTTTHQKSIRSPEGQPGQIPKKENICITPLLGKENFGNFNLHV